MALACLKINALHLNKRHSCVTDSARVTFTKLFQIRYGSDMLGAEPAAAANDLGAGAAPTLDEARKARRGNDLFEAPVGHLQVA